MPLCWIILCINDIVVAVEKHCLLGVRILGSSKLGQKNGVDSLVSGQEGGIGVEDTELLAEKGCSLAALACVRRIGGDGLVRDKFAQRRDQFICRLSVSRPATLHSHRIPLPKGNILEETVDRSVTSQKATVLSFPPVINMSRSWVKKTVEPRIFPEWAHQLALSENSELNCCPDQ